MRLTPATAGVLVLLAIVVWLVGAPITGLVVGSITDTAPGTPSRFTFATLAYAYGDFEHLRSLANSLVFATITATLVLVIGGGLAWAAAGSAAPSEASPVLVPPLMASPLFVAKIVEIKASKPATAPSPSGPAVPATVG